MSVPNVIETDYAVHPGAFIREWLDENDMSQGELARRMDVSSKHVSKLLSGARLTEDVALKLELVTGIASRIWLSYEATYRADLARIGATAQMAAHIDEIQAYPVPFLRKQGFISATARKPGELVLEVLAFFGVASLDELHRRSMPPGVAFRQDAAVAVSAAAVQTWLQIIHLEVAASDPVDHEFDAAILEELIPSLRALSATADESTGATLVSELANAGVKLLFVQETPGIRAHGIAFWDRGRFPVVALTARGKEDGKFWFSLFHEICHLLKHKHDDVYIDYVKEPGSEIDAREAEADSFASDVLISSKDALRLPSLHSKNDIASFAAEIGVSPGVVVGRLHHEGLWPHSHGRELLTRIEIIGD